MLFPWLFTAKRMSGLQSAHLHACSTSGYSVTCCVWRAALSALYIHMFRLSKCQKCRPCWIDPSGLQSYMSISIAIGVSNTPNVTAVLCMLCRLVWAAGHQIYLRQSKFQRKGYHRAAQAMQACAACGVPAPCHFFG